MKKVLFFLVAIALNAPVFGQLALNNALTPAQLVQNVLLGGGVTATNITFTGASVARSSFTCAGNCNLGVSDGILLSSGAAIAPAGPASYFHSTANGTPGDAQLDAIVTPRVTFDAAVLEFDFVVASDSVKFEYVFGSEEYNDYANTNFNDVFAFFISGPGIVGAQNIALIPGTTTPVSINNVNNGNSAGVSSGPCMNCQYFVDNITGPSVYFDAFTTVLTAKAAVQPCQTYHIKLAIADAGDGVFDSGVFLKGGSFSSLGDIAVIANGTPLSTAQTYYACTGTTVNLCLNPASNYNWSTSATSQCISVDELNITPTGQYQAFVLVGSCFAFTEVTVQFVTPTAVIAASGPLSLCPGNTVTLTANNGNSYLWSNGATTQSITVGTAGNYIVTVNNGPNCTAVSTPVTVTVGNATAQITGLLSLCSGANTTLTANPGQSYLWNTGVTTSNISVTTAGNYTVTVTQAGGCTATATVNVQVNANPIPAITGLLSICQGASTQLNGGAGFTGYLWTGGAATPNLTVTTNGTYTVTVTNAAGCTGTTSAAVVVHPLPVPAITGNTAFCLGNNSNITATAGFPTYLWSNGLGTPTINVTTAGNYTVTVTDGFSCSASTSVAIVVNPLPVPNITGTFAFCQGSNTSITPGPGYTSYLWNNGAATPSLTVSAGNTYTVTVTNANGCTGTDSQLITVNPNPLPSITGTLAICQGANTTLSGPAGFSSYSWSTGAASQNVNLTLPGTYTLTVTNANGCSGTTSANLVVHALPVPAITGTAAFCQGANSNLNAGGGFTSYLWNTGAVSQLLNVTATGNYVVTVSNVFGCTASTNLQVTVNPLPVPVISGPAAICSGSSANLNAGGVYASYLWNTGATTQIINSTTAGMYTVTVTSAVGCTGSTTKTLIVNPLPTPVISGITTICQGTSTTLSLTSGYSAYSWSTGSTAATLSTGLAGPVSVTVTDANGCSSTTASNITVNPLPTPVITGINAFCQGQNSTLDAGVYSSYLWNTGAVSRTINVNTGGNYTVTVTAATGCSGSDNQLITVNQNPAPVILGGTGICQGTSTTLNAGGGFATYLWNNGAVTQQIPVTTAGNYTVTVSSAFGCVGSATTSMQVNPLPTPFITGVAAICQGTTTTFNAGAGYSAYSWSTGATTPTITPGIAGNYIVTVTDNNGCSQATNRILTVNALPTPSITGTMAFCQGNNSNINAGGGYVNYLWNGGQTTQIINVTTAGNYIVTVTDVNGCTGATNSIIVVNPNPTPVINGGTGICSGTTTALTVPGSYATYLWNTGDVTPSISVGTAGTYSVTVTSIFGCSGSNSTAMIINPLPSPVITGTTAICQGTTTSFNAGSGYNNYLWSNGSVAQNITPGVAGIYTVTVTDVNGCVNNDDITLAVNALPVPAITGDLDLCQGDNTNLSASTGFVSYLWSNSAVSSMINTSTAGTYSVTVIDNNGCSGSISSLVVVHPLPVPVISGASSICQGTSTILNAGNYSAYLWSTGASSSTIPVTAAGTYSVTVTDLNGCINATSTSLIVYPLPTASLTGTAIICYGQATPLDVVFTGAAPFTYSYTTGAAPITAPPVNGNSTMVNVSPGASTTYTLVSVNDAHCAGNILGNAAIISVNPLPLPVIIGNMSICDGQTTNLNVNGNYTSYSWSNNVTQPILNTGAAGIYTVTVIDNNGCQGTSPAVNLIVHAVPVVAFTNDTSLTCSVPQINFTNLSLYDAGSVFNWNFGDGTTSVESNPAHLFFAPGTYPIALEITTPYGCVSNATNAVNILFYPLPEADFVTAPAVTNVFNGKVSFVDRSANAISWLWEFGDGAFSNDQNPEHYYSEVGDYHVTLRVTNVAGCVDKTEDPVTINPFYIPNAFTPNADGVNDVFYYSGYDLDVASYNMRIFNRWGQLVFTGQSENDNWNGTTNSGDLAPQGTYIYRLLIKTRAGKDYSFNGQVNLIR